MPLHQRRAARAEALARPLRSAQPGGGSGRPVAAAVGRAAVVCDVDEAEDAWCGGSSCLHAGAGVLQRATGGCLTGRTHDLGGEGRAGH